MIGGSIVAGLSLVAFGIGNRTMPEFFHPPAIWLCGIVTLLSVPFQICVLPERARRRRPRGIRAVPIRVVARRAEVARYLSFAAPRLNSAPRIGPHR
jgi:hypothetical protein